MYYAISKGFGSSVKVRNFQTLREAKRYAQRIEDAQGAGAAFVASYCVLDGIITISGGWVFNPFTRRWLPCRRVTYTCTDCTSFRPLYQLFKRAYAQAVPRLRAAAVSGVLV